jgi:hypothetical protein
MDETYQYWLNPHRPDKVYRTNGVMCQQKTLDGPKWLANDTKRPALPSPYRYEVSESELQREPAHA